MIFEEAYNELELEVDREAEYNTEYNTEQIEEYKRIVKILYREEYSILYIERKC